MSKWLWVCKNIFKKLWIRALLFCLVGIVTALAALFLKVYIPLDISQKVGADAVGTILNIIASSMLAVTTFSLSTMVAAYATASSSATPRSTQLLLKDNAAQNALSTFIGAFLYSLVGIIALQIGVYGDSGRIILFVVTLVVIFIIVVMLLQWIDNISRLGRVGHTIAMVEKATEDSIRQRLKYTNLGGMPLNNYVPDAMHQPLLHPVIGYIQYIDMDSLSELSERLNLKIFVMALPGAFNDSQRPIINTTIALTEKDRKIAQNAFVIDVERSFDQDPRYGLIVLSEIASRALSPAVNDPGTAIQVIGACVRMLAIWLQCEEKQAEVMYPRLFVPSINIRDLFDDAFSPIGRDGAGLLEVGIRLQKSYASLAALGGEFDSKRHSALSLKHAMATLKLQEEKDVLSTLSL